MWEITSQGGPFCLGGFLNTVAHLQKPETDLGKVGMALDKSMTLPMNALRTKHSLLSGTDKPAMSSSSGRTSHRLEKACQWGDFGHSVMLCAPGPIVPGPQVPGRRRHHPTRRRPGAVGLGDRNGMGVWGWVLRKTCPAARNSLGHNDLVSVLAARPFYSLKTCICTTSPSSAVCRASWLWNA